MLTWVIVILLIGLVFIFLRVRHVRHKIYAVIIILLLLFFYITVSKLISNNQTNLKSFEGIVQVTKIYFSWLGNVFVNLKDITGRAIGMDWKTNMTEESK